MMHSMLSHTVTCTHARTHTGSHTHTPTHPHTHTLTDTHVVCSWGRSTNLSLSFFLKFRGNQQLVHPDKHPCAHHRFLKTLRNTCALPLKLLSGVGYRRLKSMGNKEIATSFLCTTEGITTKVEHGRTRA